MRAGPEPDLPARTAADAYKGRLPIRRRTDVMGIEIRNAIKALLRWVDQAGEVPDNVFVGALQDRDGELPEAMQILRRAVAGTVPDARPTTLAQSLRFLGFGARDRGI